MHNPSASSSVLSRAARGALPLEMEPTGAHHRDTALFLEEEARDYAAGVIQTAWAGFTGRREFVRLCDALRMAEQLLATELLRHVAPVEAKMLNDAALRPVVRFRLAGAAFPPRIVFKVFLSNEGWTPAALPHRPGPMAMPQGRRWCT